MTSPVLPLLTRHAMARCRSRKVPPELAVQAVLEGRAVPAEKGQDMAAGEPFQTPDEDISEAGMQEKSEPAEAGDRESGTARQRRKRCI